MDGDIQRREALVDDAPDLLFADVRQGDVRSIEIGEAVILVLDVEGSAHPPGELMDEAEQAVVATLSRLRVRKVKTQGSPGILFELQLPDFSPLLPDFQNEILARQEHLGIDQIPYGMSVDGQQDITGLQFQLFSDAPGFYRDNLKHGALPSGRSAAWGSQGAGHWL
jgi:hypothetical protein